MKSTLNIFASLLILLFPTLCYGQKFINIQKSQVLLPASVKIDGQAKEWNDNLQAFNKNTNIYSTIANNAQYLYLIVQAKEPIIIKKIIGGGITFTICTNGSREDKNPYSVTYPVIASNTQTSIFSTINEMNLKNGEIISDSLIRVANDKLNRESKTISLKGFKTIEDTLLSIYNKSGIKAAIRIDSKGLLTCEYMIPVKLIGVLEKSNKIIAYNIMLNSPTVMQSQNFNKGKMTAVAVSIPRSLSNNQSDSNVIQYPTDFWGLYPIKN